MSDPKRRDLPSMSRPDVASLGQMGEYRLLEKLGEGGMGVVYKALHTELDRIVALKVLPKGRRKHEEAIARFQREMKAIGRLDHPNLVRAYDARVIEGTRVLVMEYVDGLDLSEVVERLGPLPVADACELARQAAAGLEHAHLHGLVHRDVKPSNLMLSRDGRVKLLDLGLARVHVAPLAGEETTGVDQVIGTPDYMAPEQVSDSHMVDIRADIYGLGCTLYRLLAGQAPFTGPAHQTAFSKMDAHVRIPVPPIQQLRAEVPDELVAVLDRMLAKNPDERFSSPREVAHALRRFTRESDLSRLLAIAEGRPEPPPRQFGPSAQAATPPVTVTSRVIPPEPPELGRSARVWWRKPWALAVGLATVSIALGLTAAIMMRPADDRTIDVEPTIDPKPQPLRQVDESRQATEIWRIDLDDASSQQPTSEAVVSRAYPRSSNEWIVLSWTSPEQGKPALWLLAPRGRKRFPLTRNADSLDVQAKFSPDGRRIAFVRRVVPTGRTDLWVCNTDGTGIRRLATDHGESERVALPVWVSNSRIYYTYTRASKLDSTLQPKSHADSENSRLVFRFQDSLGQIGGLVTDVSPDGQQLAVIAWEASSWATSNVYVTDLRGRLVATVWEDREEHRIDANALWSPDGKSIAWQHCFTSDGFENPQCYGVGLARLGSDGQWTVRLPTERTTRIMPLAWAPNSRCLLCARIHDLPPKVSEVTLFIMDDRFQAVGEPFDLPVRWRYPADPTLGGVADWAFLPPDAPLPPPARLR